MRKWLKDLWRWLAAFRGMAGSFAGRRAAHLRLGRRGERLAGRLLAELGFDLLARNCRCTHGELDLVARDGGVLCFVEVKTRHRIGRARPAAAVGREKRRNLVRAAHQYLREAGFPPVPYRFDIIEVLLDGRRPHDLRHYPNAFTTDDVRRPGRAR